MKKIIVVSLAAILCNLPIVGASAAVDPSPVMVRVAEGQSGLGKVSGGNKSYEPGAKVSVRATANKGSAFVGWFIEGECVSTSASYSYVATDEATELVAEFVSAKDDYLQVSAENVHLDRGEKVEGWYENVGYSPYFQYESCSTVTLSVKGLPPGVKFSAATKTFSGSPTKDGVYYVTISAKNANGYQHSAIGVWTVGVVPIGLGDYDNIGIDWDSFGEDYYDEESGEWRWVPISWRTGEDVHFSFYYAVEDDVDILSVSGLPSGLKEPICPPDVPCGHPPWTYHGKLTKPGVYTVNVTARIGNASIRKARKTIIVEDAGCVYLDLVSADPLRGSVSGAGVYPIGKKAKISAKSARNFYFAGWYCDEGLEEPFEDYESGNYLKASASVEVDAHTPQVLYARFIAREEDSVMFDIEDEWVVETRWGKDRFYISVHSETEAKVAAKGLPSGMKLSYAGWGKWRITADPSKLKPGVSDVSLTAKTATGLTVTKNLRVVVPNLRSRVFSGLNYSDSAYTLTVGVGSDSCYDGCGCGTSSWIAFEYDESFKLSITGLPSGLKYRAENGYVEIFGTPTKAGVYTVTLTARDGNYTEKATFTINVNPLPEYAVGTFNGVLKDVDSGDVVGSFVFTAAANGKQSVKVVTKHGTMSLSASAWNICFVPGGSSLEASFYKFSKNESFEFFLELGEVSDWNCTHQLKGHLYWKKMTARGDFEMFEVEAEVDTAQRNPFAKTKTGYEHPVAVEVAEELAAEYKSEKMVILWDWDSGRYYLECADCADSDVSYGTATLKMNKNGTGTLSGKLYGIYSFTATATLMFDTACKAYDNYLLGEHFLMRFTPIVKMQLCPHASSSDKCVMENEIAEILWQPIGR